MGEASSAASRALSTDQTASHLAGALPEGATVCVIGWSGHVVDALVRRGDVHALVLDSLGDGAGPVFVVPCDEPHSAEVVSSFTFTADEWPGSDAVADTVLAYCATQLARGGALESAAAGREWVAWVPSEGTWRHGDRVGLCIVTEDIAWEGKAA